MLHLLKQAIVKKTHDLLKSLRNQFQVCLKKWEAASVNINFNITAVLFS